MPWIPLEVDHIHSHGSNYVMMAFYKLIILLSMTCIDLQCLEVDLNTTFLLICFMVEIFGIFGSLMADFFLSGIVWINLKDLVVTTFNYSLILIGQFMHLIDAKFHAGKSSVEDSKCCFFSCFQLCFNWREDLQTV